jgi:hypothetical protein
VQGAMTEKGKKVDIEPGQGFSENKTFALSPK